MFLHIRLIQVLSHSSGYSCAWIRIQRRGQGVHVSRLASDVEASNGFNGGPADDRFGQFNYLELLIPSKVLF